MTTGIYQIRNKKNGKKYIGSSFNIEKRWTGHKWGLNRGRHSSTHLQNAWNKYGEGSFEFTILKQCSILALISNEQKYMDKLQPEYNMRDVAGSMLGYKHSAQSKANMADSHRGFKHSEETIVKMSTSAMGLHTYKGRTVSAETRVKLALTSKGNTHFLGHTHTEETKHLISQAHKGKIVSAETGAKLSLAKKAWWAKKRGQE